MDIYLVGIIEVSQRNPGVSHHWHIPMLDDSGCNIGNEQGCIIVQDVYARIQDS